MKPSLRQVLADSHVAAVTIALLLLWSIENAFAALWDPASRAFRFMATAVAIHDIPYFSPTLTAEDRALLVFSGEYLYLFVVSLSAAWLVSKWVYGVGPVRALSEERSKLIGRKDA